MTDGNASVKRTHEWVEREYGEEKWPAVERLIDEVVAREGDAPDLSRVVAQVARWDWYEGTSPADVQDAVVDGRPVRAPQSAVVGGYQQLVTESVLEACAPGADVLVELGSGWGRNVFAAWLAGGAREMRYVAAEYTDAGRRAASRIAALEPGLDFISLPFDYHHPDLGELGHAARAVVFSAHSIEQIPQLSPALFETVRGLADEVVCLHFEPVGWQLGGPGLTGSSREYAATHDYNQNLVGVVRDEEAAGRLTITDIRPEIIGARSVNASTLIAWRAPAA